MNAFSFTLLVCASWPATEIMSLKFARFWNDQKPKGLCVVRNWRKQFLFFSIRLFFPDECFVKNVIYYYFSLLQTRSQYLIQRHSLRLLSIHYHLAISDHVYAVIKLQIREASVKYRMNNVALCFSSCIELQPGCVQAFGSACTARAWLQKSPLFCWFSFPSSNKIWIYECWQVTAPSQGGNQNLSPLASFSVSSSVYFPAHAWSFKRSQQCPLTLDLLAIGLL